MVKCLVLLKENEIINKILDALEDLFQATSPFIDARDIDGLHMSNCYNIIEKELKALEIIKRIVKIVDYSDHTIANGNLIILQGGEIKTQEEYDLLKEVFL